MGTEYATRTAVYDHAGPGRRAVATEQVRLGSGDLPLGHRARPRCPQRSLNGPHACCGEHRIECFGGLDVPVPDQEIQAVGVVFEVHRQLRASHCTGARPPANTSGS